MVRTALLTLAVIAVASLFLALRPVPNPPIPPRGVTLENVQLTLYPEEDRDARWEFKAGQVEQDPSSREAQVTGLEAGKRFVKDKLELRMYAPSVTIDRFDNLTTPHARVEILKGCYNVQLGKEGELNKVLIDQRTGFKAPLVSMASPTIKVEATNFESDFAIESPSWNVKHESFTTGGQKPPCTIEGGTN